MCFLNCLSAHAQVLNARLLLFFPRFCRVYEVPGGLQEACAPISVTISARDHESWQTILLGDFVYRVRYVCFVRIYAQTLIRVNFIVVTSCMLEKSCLICLGCPVERF